ncbi:NUDIX hydrolase [Sphingomonas fennica]|uniref:GDP-mannose pyrophosphatase n=1 Tax=Edaphosphingomonas fennica TaxID=114404 RepID=A0A2T4HNJ6_9SPHN|nr:NUDIX hydrolase [Sphingomonas fennica]PTD17383.1 NUDIX hydrolase [Sphingomonas fennica]
MNHDPVQKHSAAGHPRPDDADQPAEILWQGRFIEARRKGKWEYVGRARGIGAAVILAVDDGHVLLVEQYRVPLGAPCLELPAGLVGDDVAGEPIEAAAGRELEEETGYRAGRLENAGCFAASPGMVSETFTLIVARDLVRVGPGGGVEGENIVVHRVPLDEVSDFVAERRRARVMMDVKLLLLLGAGLIGSTLPDGRQAPATPLAPMLRGH